MTWVRSSKCGAGTCVEVVRDGDEILVRDGKDPGGPVLRFPVAAWEAFLTSVRAGEFRF